MTKEEFLERFREHKYGSILSPHQFLPYIAAPGGDQDRGTGEDRCRPFIWGIQSTGRTIYHPCEMVDFPMGAPAVNARGAPWSGDCWTLYEDGFEIFGACFRWLPVVELVDLLCDSWALPVEDLADRMAYRNDHGDDRILVAECLSDCEKWAGWGPRTLMYRVPDWERPEGSACWDATASASLPEVWSLWARENILEVNEEAYRAVPRIRCYHCGH